MTIGERIKKKREELGLTQEELGRLCGTTKQSVFKYENGIVTNIPLDRLSTIAEKLNVSTAYLMGWEEERPTAGQGDGPKERARKLLDMIPEDKLQDVISYMEFVKSREDKR